MSANVPSPLRSKLLSWLGIGGCISCYVAMTPATILGIVALTGISAAGAAAALAAYTSSSLFVPILVLSVILLVAGTLPRGRPAAIVAVLAGIAIVASMTVFFDNRLFLTGFLLLAAAQLLGLRRGAVALSRMRILMATIPFIAIAAILALLTYSREFKPPSSAPAANSPIAPAAKPSGAAPAPSTMQMGR